MNIKRGSTLSFLINLPEMIVTDIKCQIKDSRENLIDTLILSKQTDTRWLALSEDTSKYPIGELYFDIKIWSGIIVISSETMSLTVIKEVTV